jgi:hypothetical protein
MKHKHHIIPKHIGGTDDPSNLIELTVEEHAEAHRLLWEQDKRWQDYYAWQGLSGMINKEELIKRIQSLANSKPKSEETKEKMRKSQLGKKQTEQSKEKNSKKAKERWQNGVYDAEKLRLSRIGFKQPESQKQKVSDFFSKQWSITTPTGETLIINNLNQFCKENNLDQGNMSRGKHKGWKCIKISS